MNDYRTTLRMTLLAFLLIFSVNCQKENIQLESDFNISENKTAVLKSAHVSGYLSTLIENIGSLVEKEMLGKGVGNSLESKVSNAINNLVRGNNNSAKGQLSAFINEVKSLIENSIIPADLGLQLITMAENSILLIDGSFTDLRDGQKYAVVLIGNQLWMAENLKATQYNDGSPIPQLTANQSWITTTDGAYCWYDNDEATYKQTYGALYNWYAVDTGILSPKGWHIPSNTEWLTLIDYLGGENIAGSKLKEAGTSHWLSPNTGATNESKFTALPAGDRIGADGTFYNIYGYAIFWSSDGPTETLGINRVLVFDDTNFRIGYDNKFAGFSVRCVKDY